MVLAAGLSAATTCPTAPGAAPATTNAAATHFRKPRRPSSPSQKAERRRGQTPNRLKPSRFTVTFSAVEGIGKERSRSNSNTRQNIDSSSRNKGDPKRPVRKGQSPSEPLERFGYRPGWTLDG